MGHRTNDYREGAHLTRKDMATPTAKRQAEPVLAPARLTLHELHTAALADRHNMHEIVWALANIHSDYENALSTCLDSLVAIRRALSGTEPRMTEDLRQDSMNYAVESAFKALAEIGYTPK